MTSILSVLNRRRKGTANAWVKLGIGYSLQSRCQASVGSDMMSKSLELTPFHNYRSHLLFLIYGGNLTSFNVVSRPVAVICKFNFLSA